MRKEKHHKKHSHIITFIHLKNKLLEIVRAARKPLLEALDKQIEEAMNNGLGARGYFDLKARLRDCTDALKAVKPIKVPMEHLNPETLQALCEAALALPEIRDQVEQLKLDTIKALEDYNQQQEGAE